MTTPPEAADPPFAVPRGYVQGMVGIGAGTRQAVLDQRHQSGAALDQIDPAPQAGQNKAIGSQPGRCIHDVKSTPAIGADRAPQQSVAIATKALPMPQLAADKFYPSR